jgi:hypothetical protein
VFHYLATDCKPRSLQFQFTDQATTFAVTGASRGYAFVEYETDREMRRAYEVSINFIISESLFLPACFLLHSRRIFEIYLILPLAARMHTIPLLMAVK